MHWRVSVNKTHNMKILITVFLNISLCFGSTYTTNNSGDWSSSSNWVGGNIGPLSGNSNTIVISSSNTITLNNNIEFGNNCILDVNGILTINGDLTANNSLTILVSGQLIINGSLIGKNGASVSISGDAIVSNDVTFDNSGIIELSGGNLDIGGTLSGGTGCEIIGTGLITIDGANTFDTSPESGIEITAGMPIELLSFSAEANNDYIIIKWTTSSETNNAYFTLYRSCDATKWEQISSLAGAGTTNTIANYSVIDNIGCNEITYYKLSQTDIDGLVRFMDPIFVLPFINNPITILPDEILIKKPKSELSILNLQNIVIEQKSIYEDYYVVDTSQWSNGLYIIVLRSEGQISTHRYLKIN